MGRPVFSLVIGAGLLIALATPVLDIETGVSGVSNTPAGTEARDALERLRGTRP